MCIHTYNSSSSNNDNNTTTNNNDNNNNTSNDTNHVQCRRCLVLGEDRELVAAEDADPLAHLLLRLSCYY